MDATPTLPIPTADPYDAWRAAEADEALAYRAWCRAGRHERREAYSVFLAASDRAAAAADALRAAASPAG